MVHGQLLFFKCYELGLVRLMHIKIFALKAGIACALKSIDKYESESYYLASVKA